MEPISINLDMVKLLDGSRCFQASFENYAVPTAFCVSTIWKHKKWYHMYHRVPHPLYECHHYEKPPGNMRRECTITVRGCWWQAGGSSSSPSRQCLNWRPRGPVESLGDPFLSTRGPECLDCPNKSALPHQIHQAP